MPETDPITRFGEWFELVKQSGIGEPTHVFLTTSTGSGVPSCRVVLLKSFAPDGFVIYTNSHSRKGRELLENPRASLLFFWPHLGRQVAIEGHVEPVTDAEADAYFASRPVKSRIGAWASQQSQPMANRNDLLKRLAYYSAQWASGNTPRPPHWTGFRIHPERIEFMEWCEEYKGSGS